MLKNILSTSGIMDYSFSSAAWSDCHSNLALSWPEANTGGIQALHYLRNHGGLEITKQFLNWQLVDLQHPLQPHFVARETYPERVVETATFGTFKLTTTMSWIERNTLCLDFLISHTSDTAQSTTLVFEYEAKNLDYGFPGGKLPRVACEAGRKTYYRRPLSPMFGAPQGSWHLVFDYCQDPNAGLMAGATRDDQSPAKASYAITGRDYPIYCYTELTDCAFTIQAGDSVKHQCVLTFGSNIANVQQNYDRNTSSSNQWTSDKATRRIQSLLDQAPDMDPDFADDPAFEQLYLQAICGLNSIYVQGDGGLAGTHRIPWTCKHVLAGGFFWDTAFTSVGGVWINPQAAQESISAFCRNANHRGAMPANLTDLELGGEGQYPIMTWAAWNIFAQTGDTTWLQSVLPALERHVEHWFTFFSRENGLCYIYNSYLGNDDDARFDYCMKGLYNQPVDKIDSPDINAKLAVELAALAKIHQALGDSESAARFQQRADRLNQQIVDHFYFPEKTAFLDTEQGSRDIKSGVLTPHMFMPLWAATPLERSAIQGIIDNHMLDPEKFYRDHPFPSLAYDHPEYDPEGYWRGRIWPHMVFWMVQTLWQHGYQEASTTIARNLLRMMVNTPWICENYNSETGIGWSPETHRGWPAFAWCYSTVVLLISGKHKLPPLPEQNR